MWLRFLSRNGKKGRLRVSKQFKVSVPIFDANAALGRRHDRRVIYDQPQDLLLLMSRLGVSRALVYNPYSINFGTMEGNRFLLKAVSEESQLVPQLVVSFATDDLGEVQALVRESNVRSLRVFPNSHNYPLVSWIADPWLRWMAKEKMVLWVPMGRQPEVDVRDLYETAHRHPRVPVVLVGNHYSNYSLVWPLLKALDHLYFDLSRFDLTNGVERLIDHIGAGRLLFGSDFPEVDPEPYLYYLHHCRLQSSDLRAICHDNLQRLLFGKE